MSRYEFSLRQEVLMEKGAGVLGDLFRYEDDNNISDNNDPIVVLHDMIWNAKQDILLAKTLKDLDDIEAQFDFASRFMSRLNTANA